MRKSLRWIVIGGGVALACAAVAAPLLSFAANPTTQSTPTAPPAARTDTDKSPDPRGGNDGGGGGSDNEMRPRFHRGGPFGGGGDGSGFRSGGFFRNSQEADLYELPDEDTWKKVSKFMEQNSPERFKRFSDVSDQEKFDRLRKVVTARYKTLEQVKERDPELYDLRVKRMNIEDQIFGLSLDLRHSEGSPAATKDLRQKLRQQVSALFANRVDEHKHMLAQLEQKVVAEKKRVDDLTAKSGDEVSKAVNRLVEGDRMPPVGDVFGPLFAPPARPMRDGGGGDGSSSVGDAATSPAEP